MKIATIRPMDYKQGELSYYQFIRGGIGSDYHQEPVFYQFPDGEVLMYWSAYDYDECSGNAVKLFSTSTDNGVTWSNPQVFMADFLGGVPYFVLMLSMKNSKKAIMLKTRTRHNIQVDEKKGKLLKGSNYFQSSTRIYLRHSEDGGRTFDYGVEIPWEQIADGRELPGTKFYGSICDIIQLESGRVLAAFSFMDPARMGDAEKPIQHCTGVCLLSDDEGQTWYRSGDIQVDTPRGVMEVQLAEVGRDRVIAMFRTKGGYVYQSFSEDGGKTWGQSVPSPLTAPESMSRMMRLTSGNLIMVWNNVSSTTQYPRHPLVAALSLDNGESWMEPKILAKETGTHQLSNHGIIQLEEGRILVGISHYRNIFPQTSDLDFAVFDEEWLLK